MFAVAYFNPQSSLLGVDWLFFAVLLLACGAVLQYGRVPRKRDVAVGLLTAGIFSGTVYADPVHAPAPIEMEPVEAPYQPAVIYRSVQCGDGGGGWLWWMFGC